MLAGSLTARSASWPAGGGAAGPGARAPHAHNRPDDDRERGEAPPLDRIREVAEWRHAGRLPGAHVAVRRLGGEQQDMRGERPAERARELLRAGEARDLGPGVGWIWRRAPAREPRARQT